MEIEKKAYHNPVFYSSLLVIFLITILSAIFPTYLNGVYTKLQSWLSTNVGWLYVLSVVIILLLTIYLCFSRVGDIKLGPDHVEAEFNNLSWFSMLFSAGMGIGLMFWGVAEPLMHLSAPPVGEAFSLDSAKAAIQITFFHWGIHAWAIYGMLAVTMAYFSYRKNIPLLPRSVFYPILGEKIHGTFGDVVDTFAVISTIFGVASSLGLGVVQIGAGLNYLFNMPEGILSQILLIIFITIISMLSVILGVEKGIKALSNINIILAVILMSLILFLGDTIQLMQSFVQNTGAYFSDLIYKTFNLYAYERKESWIGGWTLLYWGWWISWSPFVGMFIARISKGRTIREFMLGVLFAPTLFTFLWMTIFGNSAINLVLNNESQILIEAIHQNVPIELFKFFEFFPFSSLLSLIGLVLVMTFFISSSDSGALVVTSLVTSGEENPATWQKVLWSVIMALVASTLLFSGGLGALHTMTILTSFPVLLVILIGAYCLIKSLQEDVLMNSSVQHHNTILQHSNASSSWQKRLKYLVVHPELKEVESFINNVVWGALEELKNEMCSQGMEVTLKKTTNISVAITAKKQEAENFFYEIRIRNFEVPEYAVTDNKKFYRAEVFLLNGGLEYDIFGYSKEQIIADALMQYEKHIHFLHKVSGEEILFKSKTNNGL
jgi:choline/glycine/proline betaine transport protein